MGYCSVAFLVPILSLDSLAGFLAGFLKNQTPEGGDFLKFDSRGPVFGIIRLGKYFDQGVCRQHHFADCHPATRDGKRTAPRIKIPFIIPRAVLQSCRPSPKRAFFGAWAERVGGGIFPSARSRILGQPNLGSLPVRQSPLLIVEHQPNLPVVPKPDLHRHGHFPPRDGRILQDTLLDLLEGNGGDGEITRPDRVRQLGVGNDPRIQRQQGQKNGSKESVQLKDP